MPTKKRDRIADLIKEVEALAKRLRADIRKRAKATGVPKNLQAAADRLRKQAAMVAGMVEKYAHELRKELEGGSKPAKQTARKAKARPKAKASPKAKARLTAKAAVVPTV